MTDKKPTPATDSARDLRTLVGDDVTADFETDPKFVDSNPTAEASSENLAMRDTDDEEDSDDELEDDEDDEEYEDDDDDDDDDEEYEDDEDVDPEAEDDDEDEDDEEDFEDDDEDEEYEDDEDEVSSSNPERFVLKRAA